MGKARGEANVSRKHVHNIIVRSGATSRANSRLFFSSAVSCFFCFCFFTNLKSFLKHIFLFEVDQTLPLNISVQPDSKTVVSTADVPPAASRSKQSCLRSSSDKD